MGLVFVDPGCGACDRVVEHIAATAAASEMTVAVLARRGTEQLSRMLSDAPGVVRVLVSDAATAAAYGVAQVPSAVLVDATGLVSSQPAIGAEAIARLLAGRRPLERVTG